MARAGMAYIITEVRRMTDTAVGEVLVNGVSYWTDDQLENILDLHRRDVIDVELLPTSQMNAGVREWKRYYIPIKIGHFIEDAATVGAFSIVDTQGNVAPANTPDLRALTVTFTDNTNGRSYFIRCRVYDVRAAVSQVWLEKAGHRAALIEWKAGGHTLAEDQEYQHCLDMYKFHSSFRGVGVTKLVRSGYGAAVNARTLTWVNKTLL